MKRLLFTLLIGLISTAAWAACPGAYSAAACNPQAVNVCILAASNQVECDISAGGASAGPP